MFRHLTPRLVSRLVLLALVGFGTTLLIVPARSDAEQQVAAPKAAAAIFPAELVSFRPADKAPVFAAAGPGHWDVKIRERGWILHEADGWHLWYTGYDGTREGRKLLGYATSADGVEWKRHPDNPLVRDHWVEDMMVVKQGDTYYMFAEGEEDQAQLLTSPDRLHWTRVGTLDIRYTNGDRLTPGPFGTPTAWYEEGTWYLFFRTPRRRHLAGHVERPQGVHASAGRAGDPAGAGKVRPADDRAEPDHQARRPLLCVAPRQWR